MYNNTKYSTKIFLFFEISQFEVKKRLIIDLFYFIFYIVVVYISIQSLSLVLDRIYCHIILGKEKQK